MGNFIYFMMGFSLIFCCFGTLFMLVLSIITRKEKKKNIKFIILYSIVLILITVYTLLFFFSDLLY